MHLSPLHLLVVAIVVLVLFGKGKVSNLMGEFGRGITAFKKGVSDGTSEIEKEAAAKAARDVTPAEAPVEADKDKV
ncbi:twin-arginine translocase TatA/TatE family subunit [Cypionkella psychrotolerans]|uniref:twin-arginine translocase TatA/TatE family subunit n=1 Tax=Cypionkella psychrotolerans TaxID=1678131 RepID=UPI000AA5E847|nr:twin-arginine translocase TatA/TatE family subunit [Cypionkella psychrotolerans]